MNVIPNVNQADHFAIQVANNNNLSSLPTFDFAALEAFKDELGEGSTEILAELIAIFLQDAPIQLAQMQKGVRQKDFDKLQRAAHTLKSGAALLGATRLSVLCQQLELRGKAETLAGAAEKVAQAISEYEEVKIIFATKQLS